MAGDRVIQGAVLAGGRGSRLGGSKALVPLAGRPLIAWPLAAVEAAGLAPVVVAKADSELPPLSDLPARRIDEPAEPRHPLCGIIAALEEAGRRGAQAAVIVACDMPLLPPALLARLAEIEAPLALPLAGGRPQPLVARYGTELLPALRAAAAPGRPVEAVAQARPVEAATPARPLTEIAMGLGPRLLAEAELAAFGDPARMFHNVNTEADLRRAVEWLAA